MITDVVQEFWAAMQQGDFITDAAEKVGTIRKMGARWLAASDGVRPRRGRDLKGRCLSFHELEEIALAQSAGESMRSIAVRLGVSPSTVSRELARNSESGGRYLATSAHALAYHRAAGLNLFEDILGVLVPAVSQDFPGHDLGAADCEHPIRILQEGHGGRDVIWNGPPVVGAVKRLSQ